MEQTHQLKLLKMSEVINRTGLSKTTIYVYMKRRSFPKPVNLSKRAIRWAEHEINAWIASKLAGIREIPEEPLPPLDAEPTIDAIVALRLIAQARGVVTSHKAVIALP